MSPGRGGGLAAGRGRGDTLGGHHQGERDNNVRAAGADGAAVSGARHQHAQRVRESALDPVPDHHAGAGRGGRQELLGRRLR